jgi:hypothetical protein
MHTFRSFQDSIDWSLKIEQNKGRRAATKVRRRRIRSRAISWVTTVNHDRSEGYLRPNNGEKSEQGTSDGRLCSGLHVYIVQVETVVEKVRLAERSPGPP